MKRCIVKRWLAAALCALSIGARAATPGVDAPPEPGPPRPVVVPPIAEQKLPNGVTVVVAPRHDVPLVSATLLVRVGPEADPEGRAGLADMTATLLAKGARRNGRAVGATALARQAEALGATLDTGSSWRGSNASMTVATPKLDDALALLADVVRHPLLEGAELDRARVQGLDGLRVALSSPGQVSRLALRRAFWGASAFGAVTTPASLQRLTRDDVLRFHRRWYRPDLAFVVLAGDVTPEQGLALAKRHLGDWRAPAAPPPDIALGAPQPLDKPLVVVDMPGSGQAGVAVAAPFVAIDAADRRVGQVASAVLGGGYSARVNLEVRVKRGLSYDARTIPESHESGGMLVAQAQTQNATAAEVLQLLRAEVLRLAGDAPSADELAARQATMVGSFARRLETTGGLAGIVTSQLVIGRPLAELSRYVDEVTAVTPAQVRDFAARHWSEGALRSVVAGDAKAAGEPLRRAAADALEVPIGELDLGKPALGSRR